MIFCMSSVQHTSIYPIYQAMPIFVSLAHFSERRKRQLRLDTLFKCLVRFKKAGAPAADSSRSIWSCLASRSLTAAMVGRACGSTCQHDFIKPCRGLDILLLLVWEGRKPPMATFCLKSAGENKLNAGCKLKISQSKIPKENTSQLWLYGFARTTSGAMVGRLPVQGVN